MLDRPSVMITALLVGGAVMLGALGAIVYLAQLGRSTDAIGVLVLGVLGVVWGKLRKVEAQTNGTTTKLIDHTIAQAQQATAAGADSASGD